MGKRGPKPGFSSKGATLSARITIDTRRKLDAAAAASGKKLSHELEARLVRSFDNEAPVTIRAFGSPSTYALLRLTAELIRRVEELTGQSWLDDRFTFDMVEQALRLLLNAARPDGDGAPPETFPGFVDFTPFDRANYRAGAARSIDLNRVDFLRAFVGQIVASVLVRLKDAAATTDDQNQPYRNAAEALGRRMQEMVDREFKNRTGRDPE